MKPDVALISPYPPRGQRHGGSSGVASYCANLARHLARAGASVAVLAPAEPGEPAVTSDEAVLVQRAYRRGFAGVPAAARAAVRTGAPVVHVQHETFLYGGPGSIPGFLAALAGLRIAGRPPVVTMHQVVDPEQIDTGFTELHRVKVPPGLARAGFASLQRATVRLADTVIVHEPAFARVAGDAVVVPHGVEQVERIPRGRAREQLGLSGFTAMSFGFIAPYKGLEHALSAAEHATGWDLVVAGGTHPRHGYGYAEELEARWGSDARFVGYVPDEDVAVWFSAADVVLLLYPQPHASSGPLALALAYGVPFLVSRELAETIGAPDVAVVPRDALAIRRRLQQLAEDPTARRHLASACERFGEGRGWPAVARRHLELYDRVVSS